MLSQNQNSRLLLLVSLAILTSLGCRSPFYADRGAAAGGLAGAGIGAAIGEATDEPLAGAAIGGLVGAATGGLIGNQMDDQAEHGFGRAVQPAVYAPNAIQDVIAMTSAGISDDVIIAHMQTNGLPGPLEAGDLIALKQQGVSDNVIRAMQQGPAIRSIAPAAYYEPAPAVILEPAVPFPLRRLPPCVPRRGRRGHVGVSFGL